MMQTTSQHHAVRIADQGQVAAGSLAAERMAELKRQFAIET